MSDLKTIWDDELVINVDRSRGYPSGIEWTWIIDKIRETLKNV